MQQKLIVVFVCIVFIGLTLANSSAAEGQVVLIGHHTVADSLHQDEVKEIFLGQKTRWEGNIGIVFVLPSDKQIYTAFLKDYVGKTYAQYQNYWKKQVFTGKGRMPRSFASSDELIEYVAHTEGAISFANFEKIRGNSIKIITIER